MFHRHENIVNLIDSQCLSTSTTESKRIDRYLSRNFNEKHTSHIDRWEIVDVEDCHVWPC